MYKALTLVAAFAGLMAQPSSAQDMAAAQKWGSAKLVRFRVEGVHGGREAVVKGDYEGKAEVLDRLTLEYTWDVRKRAIVEPVKVTDGKTELKDLKSDGTNCPPPQLNGAYEHFQTVSHKLSLPDQVQVNGTRTYPAARVSNYPASCSMQSIPGGREESILWVAGIDPQVLAMPNMPDGPLVVSADRKSFKLKPADNWTWTYFPTILK